VDSFRSAARTWLDEHRAEAPRDYGAILPPELVGEGRAWPRLLFAEGWAGINMVGVVLSGGSILDEVFLDEVRLPGETLLGLPKA
jgi:hypothetical protein